MDNFILLSKPYLNRSIPSEKKIIDQRVNAELMRVRKLLPINKSDLTIRHGSDLKELIPENPIKPQPEINTLDKRKAMESLSLTSKKSKKKSTKKSADNATKLPVTSKIFSSDTISNDPNENFSIGYNCPLTFTSKLNYQRVWGTVISTFVWYFVPPDNNGNYIVQTNGIVLGYYSKDKNVLTTEEVVKWHWDHDLYNKLSFPFVKFKIAVIRYDNGTPGGSTLSEEVIVTFNNDPCIHIHSMDLSSSDSNGGYPAIKGGNHGTNPTLSVYLNSPAPPSGQTVTLEVIGAGDINPSAWINSGKEQVVIPGRQIYGQWDGIIGSRKVRTTKDIHVKAKVNGSEGVSTLRIIKD